MKIKLGDEVRDRITGFEGMAVQRSEYLNGCVQFEVQPKADEKGELPDSAFVDEQQLEIIKENGEEEEEEKAGGGIRNHPKKRR